MTAPVLQTLGRHSVARCSLEFAGLDVAVVGQDLPDLSFVFGPHLGRARRGDLQVEIAPPARGGTSGPRDMCVRRPDGLPVLRSTLHGWRNIPPPLPPFAAVPDRYALIPATVVACDGVSLALTGARVADCVDLAVALLARTWRLVSSHLLVLDRHTGQSLPLHTPLELRGRTAEEVVARLGSSTAVRRSSSVLCGRTLLARPEAVGPVVPVGSCQRAPVLVRLCRSDSDRPRLARRDSRPVAWPAGAAATLPSLEMLSLSLPQDATADAAADSLHHEFASAVG